MDDLLRAIVQRYGFDAIGTAPAIEEVRRVFEWANSVISVAVSYLPPEEDCSDDGTPRGLVARFARGADYHRVLRRKLEQAVADDRMAEILGERYEICVDTTPIPERKLALLAGIAWPGKNGCVYVDGCGSWVALGEIVTESKLCSPVEVRGSRCGDCDLCMKMCPTGAITEPGIIDRERCLSAITQRSEPIPKSLCEKLGNRLYGCDTCQEVCPHNSGCEPRTPEFAQRMFPGKHPELRPLIEMSGSEFKRLVKPSSIGWIGRARIRRNAEAILGK